MVAVVLEQDQKLPIISYHKTGIFGKKEKKKKRKKEKKKKRKKEKYRVTFVKVGDI